MNGAKAPLAELGGAAMAEVELLGRLPKADGTDPLVGGNLRHAQ